MLVALEGILRAVAMIGVGLAAVCVVVALPVLWAAVSQLGPNWNEACRRIARHDDG